MTILFLTTDVMIKQCENQGQAFTVNKRWFIVDNENFGLTHLSLALLFIKKPVIN